MNDVLTDDDGRRHVLFIGGPRHNQVHLVPMLSSYRVPVDLGRLSLVPPNGVLPKNATLETVTYYRHKIVDGSFYREIFCTLSDPRLAAVQYARRNWKDWKGRA